MKKRVLYSIVLGVCAVVFVFSAYQVISYYVTSHNEAKVYSGLKAQVTAKLPEQQTDLPKYADSGKLYCYDSLYEENHDLIGWVSIPDTQVDYPVMQTKENEEYYLRRNFHKKSASSGTPFMDQGSAPEDPYSCVIIYGHNMKSGDMFHELEQYTDKTYFETHPTIAFDTLYEQREYQIAAVVEVDLNDKSHFQYYAHDAFPSSDSYDAFLAQAKEEALYDTGVTGVYGQQMLILSTCSYAVSGDSGRLAVIAVQTNPGDE